MNMVTMPVQYDPANPNRVLVDKAKAKQVWTALKDDRPIPKAATKGTATGTAKGVVGAAVLTLPRRTAPGNRSPRPPVLGDTASPGRLVRRPRFTPPHPAAATRRPPETRRHLEARHPPRVRRDAGQLHLWRVVHHPEHDRQRHHPRRGLLRVPPVLHGQAEDPRHRWPCGPLRGPLRQGCRCPRSSEPTAPVLGAPAPGRTGTGALRSSPPRLRPVQQAHAVPRTSSGAHDRCSRRSRN